jgi:epoxyqueuosine reductase QueG
MGNSRNKEFLPVLNQMAADEDEVVRESAVWAKKRLSTSAE